MTSFAGTAASWVASRGSPKTREAYSRDLHLWLQHCQRTGADAAKPTQQAAIAFRDELLKTEAALSVRRRLACVRAIYSALRPGETNWFLEKHLPSPPASSYSRTEAVSIEDARATIAAAATRGKTPARDAALLWVLWSTGMRRVSAASIRRDGVIRRGDTTIVRYILKGGKEHENELPSDAVDAVRTWLGDAPPSKWLFCTNDGKRPLTPQAVTKIVALASRAAGLHVHPHQFRSAAATNLIDAGAPIESVRAFLGHESIASTLRYDTRQRGVGMAAKLADFRRGSS
jgi:site-specific recombinase XerD